MSNLMDALDFYNNDNEIGSVIEIEIDKLVPFKNHPFELYKGERLSDMVDSIKENGILSPIIVRESKSNYEILAGHNRTNAARLAGLSKVPCIVKNRLTDEEAYIYVIETNLIQRSFNDLRISEKALVLAERYNNIKSQGKRNDILKEIKILNGEDEGSAELESKKELNSTNSRDNIASEYGLSSASVARLLRVNELINELKEYVDIGKIPLLAGVNLSYLEKNVQKTIYDIAKEHNIKITETLSKSLRCIKENDINKVTAIMIKPKVKTTHQKIKVSSITYERYFKDMSTKEIEDILVKAIEKYFSSEG